MAKVTKNDGGTWCRSAWFLVLTCALLLQFTAGQARAADRPVTIGVLAVRGAEQCLKSWSPTAEYLTGRIPGYSFAILRFAVSPFLRFLRLRGRTELIIRIIVINIPKTHVFSA